MDTNNKSQENLASQDIMADKLRRLKEVVPEAFDEDGRLNIPALERVLGKKASFEKTRYGLQWHDKAECIKVAQEKSVATLKPAREESAGDFDKTENLFIEGDNLEVLKLLQRAYYGKVKMIYIDPPYNTGREFIYPDKYAETLDTYLAYTGQTDENGDNFSTNTDRVGRFHSNWLSMMFPRLYLARNLLRNDGVIFVSIDDHEIHNLRSIMDEIFGEENLTAIFCWGTKTAPKGVPPQNNIVSNHEYVLCYQKQGEFSFKGKPRNPDTFKNPDDDPRGPWKAENMKSTVANVKEYAITDPKTGNSFSKPWGFAESTMKKMIDEGRVIFPDSVDGTPRQKKFASEYKSENMPIISRLDFFHTETATNKMKELFDGKKIFDFPKPVDLIQHFVEQSSQNEDIVLDFFAGSGTTAHAVMRQNAKDGGRRRFICVQLPEPTEKDSNARAVGYANIAEIGKERIRRAANQIAKEKIGNHGLDLDFKSLKLAISNFHVWEEDASQVSDLREQLARHTQPLLDEQTKDDDVLYEILLRFGLPIAATPKKEAIVGKTVYSVEDGDTLICLDKELTREAIDAMAETDARRVVCLDAGFQKNDQLKTNAKLAFQLKSERKQSEVVFITI